MIKDAQIRQLRHFLGEGHPLYRAALKVGMDVKPARKYRHAERLPSESLSPRTWRTREDPFQDVWPQLRGMLELNLGLQAKTIFADLQRRFPGRFPDNQLRGCMDMHRAPDDSDIIDWIRQPRPQRKLLSYSRIDPSGACPSFKARSVAVHVCVRLSLIDLVSCKVLTMGIAPSP